jgi:prepilin-type N-terminal cleavage/methylation domain-containing protein
MKRRAELGLTLLEVMAAVALLGILYAYLAKAASQGIVNAGDSRWRLEASLLADEELVALERQMLEGVPLEPGSSEEERDAFTVRREIEVLSLPVEEAVVGADAPPAASLLGDGSPQNPGILRRVVIRVSWFDGVDEQQIERVTFAYDPEAALPLLDADLIADREPAP